MLNLHCGRSIAITIVNLLALLMIPTAVVAQEALEEIVVTADKRGEQYLQDTAASIVVIESQALERRRVENFEDYIKMVPGVTSVSSGTGQSQLVIRGVNSNRIIHTSTQKRSLAGLYIDEMPISLTGFNPDLGIMDVERIEATS